MTMTIRMTPKSNQVAIKLGKLDITTKAALKNAWFDIGKDLKSTAQKLILEPPKTGKIYKVMINGVRIRHQASAPGQAPANMSGKLEKTVDYTVNSSTEMRFGAGGGSVNYAGFLENGRRRMQKRPYLIKSINENTAKIVTHIQDNIKKEIAK